MFLLCFFYILHIFSCSEINEDKNKSVITEVENLDQGTPSILLTLGHSLKENLLNPTPDVDRGRKTIEGLFNYYNNLRDVLEMIRSKEDVENNLGKKLFQKLVEAGGPAHLELDFDIEHTMEQYKWNNRAVFTVRKVLDETDTLWQDLQMEVEKTHKA